MEPMPGACDSTKQRIQTEGWYVDLPSSIPAAQESPRPVPAGCRDTITATVNGDPKLLGFPIAYSTTIAGADGKPAVTQMEVTDLQTAPLSEALFDVPAGMREAADIRGLSQAVSDAHEAALATALTASATPPQKAVGTLLVGVTDVVNKTSSQLDTRALRDSLVANLAAAKVNAAPLAGSDLAVAQVAGSHGYDYVVLAEVTEVKVTKGGAFGGVLKAASKVAGANSGQEPTEANIVFTVVQPDGKARLTGKAKGKDGGFDMKTGLGVAKFAGTMYMNLMTGKMMMNAFKTATTGNLGGLGMLGNPALGNMQPGGLGSIGGPSRGLDPTARAASFLMQQAISSDSAGSGATGQAQSFDAALADAFQDAAKTITENLKKPAATKK
jgi:hypothetical protein